MNKNCGLFYLISTPNLNLPELFKETYRASAMSLSRFVVNNAETITQFPYTRKLANIYNFLNKIQFNDSY